jgi:hypothetical protein
MYQIALTQHEKERQEHARKNKLPGPCERIFVIVCAFL